MNSEKFGALFKGFDEPSQDLESPAEVPESFLLKGSGTGSPIARPRTMVAGADDAGLTPN